jgi:hypothetical protein
MLGAARDQLLTLVRVKSAAIIFRTAEDRRGPVIRGTYAQGR